MFLALFSGTIFRIQCHFLVLSDTGKSHLIKQVRNGPMPGTGYSPVLINIILFINLSWVFFMSLWLYLERRLHGKIGLKYLPINQDQNLGGKLTLKTVLDISDKWVL